MKWARWLLLFLLCSCAGFDRSCSSLVATQVGADWIIVQYDAYGSPINCWQLRGESVANEHQSDGIYWVDRGHLVHIGGWYNRIQVHSNRFDEAAKILGVETEKCKNGKYGQ